MGFPEKIICQGIIPCNSADSPSIKPYGQADNFLRQKNGDVV